MHSSRGPTMQPLCDLRQLAQLTAAPVFVCFTWQRGLSNDQNIQSLYRRPHIASHHRGINIAELGRYGPKREPVLAANLGPPHKGTKLSLGHLAESSEAQITLVRNCQADLLSHFS